MPALVGDGFGVVGYGGALQAGWEVPHLSGFRAPGGRRLVRSSVRLSVGPRGLKFCASIRICLKSVDLGDVGNSGASSANKSGEHGHFWGDESANAGAVSSKFVRK